MPDSASKTLLISRQFQLSLSLRKHYKEYLVDKINKPGLDPLPLYEKEGNIESVLRREEKPIPEREEEETDEHYSQRLIEVRPHAHTHTLTLTLTRLPYSM